MLHTTQYLTKLTAWETSGPGPHTGEFSSDAGWTLRATAQKVESIGCLLNEVELQRTQPAPAGLSLFIFAEQIARDATGLMERLAVHEIDSEANVAILRSEKPTVRGPVAHYFEVRLNGLDQVSVRRYQADRAAGTRREQIAFPMTHETLAHFAAQVA